MKSILKSGDNGLKVTPVPIPNTKVKLQSADGTAEEALWKSRSSPGYIFRDSSTVEHPAVNRRVVGSNPTRGAIEFQRAAYCKSLVFSFGRPVPAALNRKSGYVSKSVFLSGISPNMCA